MWCKGAPVLLAGASSFLVVPYRTPELCLPKSPHAAPRPSASRVLPPSLPTSMHGAGREGPDAPAHPTSPWTSGLSSPWQIGLGNRSEPAPRAERDADVAIRHEPEQSLLLVDDDERACGFLPEELGRCGEVRPRAAARGRRHQLRHFHA